MSTTYTLDRSVARSQRSLGAMAAGAVENAYAAFVASLSSVMRPQAESPAEAAARLHMLAAEYEEHQPSYAADLRAAADRAHV